MKALEIICKNVDHQFKQVILFCLNLQCCSKRGACEACMQNFHSNHTQDCFNLQGIYLILENQYNALRKGKSDSTAQLSQNIQSLIDSIAQHLENLQNILVRPGNLNNIIKFAVRCYNNINYTELLSNSLIQGQTIKQAQQNKNDHSIFTLKEACKQTQKELKVFQLLQKGNELYEQKKYADAIKFYQLSLKLGDLNDDGIAKIYTSLNLTNRFQEASLIYETHKGSFQKNNLLDQIGQKFYAESNYFNHQNILYDLNDQDTKFYYVTMLMNMKCYNESLELLEKILLLNPTEFKGIQLKIEILLRQKQYGLAKEYLDGQSKLKPKELQHLQDICVMFDHKFFSNYKPNFDLNYQTKKIQECKSKVILVFYYLNLKSNQKIDHLSQIDHQLVQFERSTEITIQSNKVCYKDLQNNNTNFNTGQYGGIIQILYYISSGKLNLAGQIVDNLLNQALNSRLFHAMKCIILLCSQKLQEALHYAKLSMYLDKPIDFYSRLYICALIQNQHLKEALKISGKLINLGCWKNLQLRGVALVLNLQLEEALEFLKKCNELEPEHRQTISILNKFIKLKILEKENCEINDSYNSLTKLQKKTTKETFLIQETENSLLQFSFDFSELLSILEPTDFCLMLFQT